MYICSVNNNKHFSIMKLSRKQIASLYTKKGELRKEYYNLLAYELKGTTIRTGGYKGRGRYIGKTDNTYTWDCLLKTLNLKYTTGNDAPRGGVTGNFIKISKRALEKLQNLYSYSGYLYEGMSLEKAKEERENQRKLMAEIETKRKAKEERMEEERKAKLKEALSSAGDIESVLMNFFKNESHPAPLEVMGAKQELKKSWSELRELYKY